MTIRPLCPTEQATVSQDGVFPLPLVPFELYNLADDRAEYPKTFVYRLTFRGQTDRGAFENALKIAIQRSPLLTAVVTRAADGREVWVPTQRLPTVQWGPAEMPLGGGYGQPVDLRSEPGLAIWVRGDVQATDLILQIHHACCDGLGALCFIEDLLAAYDTALSNGVGSFVARHSDIHQLKARGVFDFPPRTLLERVGQRLVGAVEGLKLCMPASPLAPRQASSSGKLVPQGHIGFVSHHLDEGTISDLRRVAQESQATLNDLLLRDYFLTLRDWNRQHARSGRRDRLRILMPVSLRTPLHHGMPAANVMSFAFLARRAKDCDSPWTLLESIRSETQRIRRELRSIHFLGVISAVGPIPGALSIILRGKRCFATAVLSNLGDPTRRFSAQLRRRQGSIVAGNLMLESITGVPPLRPLTRAATAIMQYDRRMTISTQCDPHLFTIQDAHEFQTRYVERLRRTPVTE